VSSAVNGSMLPPGPPYPRPLQTLGWVTRPFALLERCRDRYGDIFTLKIATEPSWVFVSDPQAVKQVFTGDPRVLHAGEGNVVLLPVLGHHSVLLLDEHEHMAQRKLMLPSFHGERVSRYADLMHEIAERQIEHWPAGEPVAVWPGMQAITLDIIIRAVFGVEEAESLERLRTALREMLSRAVSPVRMAMLGVIGPRRIDRLQLLQAELRPVNRLLLEEIHTRREAPDLTERDDVLSMLVQARHEDGRPMSDAELRDELMTLLVAGHETTATALAWAVERLARHPDKLDRLREEVIAGDDAYLDAVVKETLRLRPVLPIVARRLTEPMEIGGHVLPAGVTVAPCIHLVHRRPDVYPEPARFRPERFLEQPAGTYTWIPFGGGVRRCLGASFALFEMKTVLAALVRARDLRPGSAAPERVARRGITLTPDRGGEVIFTRLDHSRPHPREREMIKEAA
jgi:cytochrome P450